MNSSVISAQALAQREHVRVDVENSNMNWQPHSQKPAEETTAIMAYEAIAGSGDYLMFGSLCMWHNGRWVVEATGQPLDLSIPFYWLSEKDLMASIGQAIQ